MLAWFAFEGFTVLSTPFILDSLYSLPCPESIESEATLFISCCKEVILGIFISFLVTFYISRHYVLVCGGFMKRLTKLNTLLWSLADVYLFSLLLFPLNKISQVIYTESL